jgi:hypothetical protein
MALYHGTSAGSAIRILTEGIRPSHNGFFYCFDSTQPESMVGALCFATGGALRCGVVDTGKLLTRYRELNPLFPKGIKGEFVMLGLKAAIATWTKTQKSLAKNLYDDRAAIIVFKDHPAAINVCRRGVINEVPVPDAALSALVVEKLYIDDTLLDIPAVAALRDRGVGIEPLSAWAAAVKKQAAAPKPPRGPKV